MHMITGSSYTASTEVDVDKGLEYYEPALSIAQLVSFNTVQKRGGSNSQFRHNAEKETPLSIYFAFCCTHTLEVALWWTSFINQNDIVKELESEFDDKEENIKTLNDNNKNLKNIKIKDIEIEKLEKIKINYDKEIKEFEEELEKSYKNINEKKVEYNKLSILNDELNEEIEELKKVLEEYSNELDKLYSSDDTKSQIKIEELEQKIIVLEK